MKCPKCNKTIGKNGYKIKCWGKCGSWYHQTCTEVKKEEVKEKSNSLIWYCPACAKEVNLSDHESEDSSSSEDETDVNIRTTDKQAKISQFMRNSINHATKKKKKSLDNPSNRELMDFFSKKFESIEEALSYNNNVMEEMRKSYNLLSTECKKLKKDYDSVKQQIINLQKQTDEIKGAERLVNSEHRNKNIIIMGLHNGGKTTEVTQELKADLKKVLNHLDFQYGEGDVKVKVLPSKMPNKPLLVTFTSPEQRNQVLANRKIKGILNTTCLNITGNERKIFINEDLSKQRHI